MSFQPLSAPHEQSRRALSEGPHSATALYQCLVVSVSPQRREMLLSAALEGGWQPLIAPDVETARKQLSRYYVQLAIVDLERTCTGDARGLHDVLEELSAQAGMLLLVCGNEGEPMEEIWARQLGVWLYLPGAVSEEDVALLCGEARQIAEQLPPPKTNGVSGSHLRVS